MDRVSLIESDQALQSRKKKLVLSGIFITISIVTILLIILSSAENYVSNETASSSNLELRPMYRYDLTQMLHDETLVCNDGTEAVYYLRKSSNHSEKRWIIRFEGGGSCANEQFCADRWATRPWDMTTMTENTVFEDEEGGIFCADFTINADFYDYNAVYAHYCSSDSWLGQRPRDNETDWHFVGAWIMYGILDSLSMYHGLEQATQILTSGMSVASVGLFNNVDRMVSYYQNIAPNSELYFLADSSWMLYDMECSSSSNSNLPPNSYQNGMAQYEYQNPLLDESCTDAGYTWECYYPAQWQFQFIENKENLIVAEQMFDRMKIGFEIGETPDVWTPDMWDCALNRAQYVVDTIKAQARNAFVSNCRDHDTINKIQFQYTQIQNTNWTHAVYSFMADSGHTPLWLIDEIVYPENNPTCIFDQNEWNLYHCGDKDISIC